MLLSRALISTFVDLTDIDGSDLRSLLDIVGIEVKGLRNTENDTLINVEVLANRGDHMSHFGVAREISAHLDRDLRTPLLGDITVGQSETIMEVCSPKCEYYALAEFRIDKAFVLPTEAREMMGRLEFSITDTVADLSNYILLEIGAPTHVFDSDKVLGRLRIQELAREELFEAIDGQEYRLAPGTLVVADELGTQAVAGIIGGRRSSVSSSTRRILVESAVFDPVTIRKTARSMHLTTRASARFERGADVGAALDAFKRMGYFFNQHGNIAEVVSGSRSVELDVSTRAISDVLGFSIGVKLAAAVLGRLGFEVTRLEDASLRLRVPSWRCWDVKDEIDIAEELVRVLGYGTGAEVVPKLSLKTPRVAPSFALAARLRNTMVGFGFTEFITSSLHSPLGTLYGTLGRKLDDSKYVRTMNGLESATSTLRRSCVDTLLLSALVNWNKGHHAQRVFEIGNVFERGDDGQIIERTVLAGLAFGRLIPLQWRNKATYDFFYLKGQIEQLLDFLGVSYKFQATSLSVYLHLDRSLDIIGRGDALGTMGQLRGEFCKDISQSLFYFELDLGKLLAAQSALPPLRDPSVFPTSTRDLTLTVSTDRVVVDQISSFLKERLRDSVSISVVDVFRPEGSPDDRVTWRVLFQRRDRSLRRSEIDEAFEATVVQVQQEFHLRRQAKE